MSTSSSSGSPSALIAPETVSYGALHLDVTDAGRALGFWHDIVGLAILDSPAEELRLGVDGRELVVLHPGAEGPAQRGHSGLYHLAIHLPDPKEFARVLWRLIVAGYPQSPTDHTMSKATYLTGPDGLGLELTLETPERLGSWSIVDREPKMIDNEGRAHAISEPLDLTEALAELPDRGFDQPLLPPATKLGHIHLHVSDLEAAVHFYRDLIGFREHMYVPELGFADLSAGGPFPHRLALNVWAGAGAPQPSPGSAGLRDFTLLLPGEQALAEALERLREGGFSPERTARGELLRDPAGNALYLST